MCFYYRMLCSALCSVLCALCSLPVRKRMLQHSTSKKFLLKSQDGRDGRHRHSAAGCIKLHLTKASDTFFMS